MNPYSYSIGEPRFNLRLVKVTSKWLRYTVDFPAVHLTQYEENNTVRGEYLRPQVGSAPLAILLHGMGDLSIIPCKLLARTLVKQGIACFTLYSVFHSSRMPEVIRNRFPDLTPGEWFEGYQVSVTDVRRVLDWANSTGEIDGGRIAVIGVSFGAFIAAITMGVDKRIGAGVFLETGGNYENTAWPGGKEGSSGAERYEAQQRYQRYLTEVAESGFENVAPAKPSYLTDPMTFAGYLRQRPVMMLNALWDKYIPRQATTEFWEACGKPAISWFPATHAGIWIWYPVIGRKITSFLKSAFVR